MIEFMSGKYGRTKKKKKEEEPFHLFDGRSFLLEQHRELGQVLSEVVWNFQTAKSSAKVFGNLKWKWQWRVFQLGFECKTRTELRLDLRF
jgi:hypothetical protein